MTTFLVFLLAYVLSQFFRTFLAVIAPTLVAELGIGTSGLANMSALFFAVFALTQFPLGLALDRIGPRRTVPTLMLAGAAGALLLANAHTTLDCILANGLIGLGCSPIYMGALYLFARTEAPARFGFLSASLIGLGSGGNLLAATPLSFAIEVLGWRGAFQGIAAITFASAALIWLVVRDPPAAPQPAVARSTWAELVEVLGTRGLWPLLPLLLLGYSSVIVERGLWIGPYLAQVHGLSSITLGNATLAMAAAMTAGALAYGLLDRVPGRRKRMIAGGYGLTAGGFLLLAMMPQPPLWLAVAVLSFIGFLGHSHPLVVAHARTFFPDHLVGRGITFVNFVTIGGAGLVQWVSGSFVSSLQATGAAAPAVYATLHLGLGIAVLVSAAVYLASVEIKAPRAS